MSPDWTLCTVSVRLVAACSALRAEACATRVEPIERRLVRQDLR